MEPHTIIQVTPATPSSTDSSKTSATSNILDNLLDELQTFSKQSSIESPISTATQRSLRSLNKQLVINNSDTIIRKGDNDDHDRNGSISVHNLECDLMHVDIQSSVNNNVTQYESSI